MRSRSRHTLFVATAVVIASTFLACSALTSFQDLIGTSGGDATSSDRAESNDGTKASDREAPAGDASVRDSQVIALCTQIDARFCDDFERESDAQGPWSEAMITQGSLALEPRDGGGTALHAHVQSSGSGRLAFLEKDFSDTVTSMKISFDVQVSSLGTADTTAYAYPFSIDFNATADEPGRAAILSEEQGSTAFYDQYDMSGSFPTEVSEFPSELALGVWHHIEFDMTFGSAPVATVYADGVKVVDAFGLYAQFVADVPYIAVGVAYSSDNTGELDYFIDNVVVTY